LKAVEGADLFLDTAVRFKEGTENDVQSARSFANTIFGLVSAVARTIAGAHHPPKAFSDQEFMRLENVLRGSDDFSVEASTPSEKALERAARKQKNVSRSHEKMFTMAEAVTNLSSL
jgi:hypothetical protein